jgi:aspartate aminotransferase-like enzyme
MPNPYRLRLPGPTEVPERVHQAIARPVVNHRGPEFRAGLARAEALIQPVLGTSNRVLFFAATGSGMMEAALVNIVIPGERLLVVCQGQFGERFATIARMLKADVDVLDVPWVRRWTQTKSLRGYARRPIERSSPCTMKARPAR